MKSDKSSLAGLFEKDSFYEIPEFQRPFSWDKDHFHDLVDDLISSDGADEYFLGSIVYYTEAGVKKVVDGQQRLTSLMILLACLRDMINDKDVERGVQSLIKQPKDPVREIEERDRLLVKDHDIFRTMVSETGGTAKAYDPRDYDEPAVRYIIAKDIFREKIEALTPDERISFMRFVSNRCVLIYLEAATFEEAFRLFEIVNDRGKQLRRIDLLKSYNLAPGVVPFPAKRKQLAAQWEEDEASIGETQFEQLFNMIRLIYTKAKPAEDLYNEFRKRIFGEKKLGIGESFFSTVSDFVDIYKQIFQDRNYLDGEDCDKQFRALMSIMSNELRTFEWRACLLSYAKKFGRKNIYEFCLLIEKVALSHLINGVRKDERYEEYTDILSAIDKSTSPNDVLSSIKIDLGAIEKKLIEDDVYRTSYEKYVLLRLELSAAELKEIRSFTARTTEHVFPQNPTEGGAWHAQATPEERKAFVNKLGNLVLLSQGKNGAAGNREFSEKKKTYLGPKVSDYPRSNQVLAYETWTREIIDERTKSSAKLVLADPRT